MIYITLILSKIAYYYSFQGITPKYFFKIQNTLEMKSLIKIGLFLCFAANVFAQSPENYTLSIERLQNFTAAPALQSFVFGQHDGKWLLIGGRTDGLHMRRPFEAFLASDNNVMLYVVDPAAKQVWSQPLSGLASSYEEQLQSTNMNFTQVDTVLYIIGGYGYSPTETDHTTFPYLTAVNLPQTIDAVVNNASLASGFRQTQDTIFQVTGGQLEYLNGTFYLVGGQKFIGRYNPMGPTHGPGFVQVYTESIRNFELQDNGTSLSYSNYQEAKDPANLHRRDYNMAPQIFPDGSLGFTAFSGVFQHTVDLPWHNTVDIRDTGYFVRNTFDQLLSQYHSAKLPIYDAAANQMETFFFGGMSRYYFDSTGVLMDDPNVPFVKTISKVVRFPNDSMVEYELAQKMPGFLGSGAEFIPLESNFYTDAKILKLNDLPYGKTLVGYIYGGIESSQENIFFSNTGVESWASNAIFEVYIEKDSVTAIDQNVLTGENVLELKVLPNPVSDVLQIDYNVPYYGKFMLSVTDAQGRVTERLVESTAGKGNYQHRLKVSDYASGTYYITLETNGFKKTLPFVVQH